MEEESCYLSEQAGSLSLQGLNGNLTDLGKMCNNGWKCHFHFLSEIFLIQRDALHLNS